MKIRTYTAIAALSALGICSAPGEDPALALRGHGKQDAEPASRHIKSVPLKVSLTNACMLALSYNPGSRAFRELLMQQDGVITEAKAVSRPHLSAKGNYETFDDNRLQSFGEGFSADSSRWNASLDASMTVFSGKRNDHYIEGQRAVKRSIGSGVKTTEEDLLVLVHAAYYAAWLADQRVAVQKEALTVLEEQLQVTENRFKAGIGEKYDVTQAEVALANARPPLIRAMNDRHRSTDRLQEIIGLPYPDGVDASGIDLEGISDVNAMDTDLKAAISRAMQSRPEMERMKHDVEAALLLLKAAEWERCPVVDVFAGFGIENDMFGTTSSLEGWNAGIRLNWDLLDGGLRRGKVQQARSRTRQVEHRSTELSLEIEGEVRKAYYDQLEADAILKASAKVIRQAREALKLASNRYKAGKGTQLDVLESQLQLTRAQLEQSTARHDLALASVQMKRATGDRILER